MLSSKVENPNWLYATVTWYGCAQLPLQELVQYYNSRRATGIYFVRSDFVMGRMTEYSVPDYKY
jgi:hypothetical protein